MTPVGTANPDQRDSDGDAVGDLCDLCPTRHDPAQETRCLALRGGRAGTLLGAACAGGDRDGDGVPNACDSCPADPNPSQDDCDGDGVGDACSPDADGDGVPNACDNCRRVPNGDQANCNADMEAARGLLDLRPGPGFSPGVGDACDDNPCPATRPGSEFVVEPLGGGRVLVANDRILGYGVTESHLGAMRTGFRRCDCDLSADLVPDDGVLQRTICAEPPPRGSGCVRSASEYGRSMVWLGMTLDFEQPGAGVQPEVVIDYRPPGAMPGARLNERVATWDILADGALPDGFGGGRLRGVVWSHAPGFWPPRPRPRLHLEMDSHYWSGTAEHIRAPQVPRPRTLVFAPALLPPEACVFCGHAFPLPYLVEPRCAVPACTDRTLFARLADVETEALGLSVGARRALGRPGLTWLAPEEPPSVLTPGALRLVGMRAGSAKPVELLFVSGGLLRRYGEQPDQGPPPPREPASGPLLAATSAASTGSGGPGGARMLLRGNTGTIFTVGGLEAGGDPVETLSVTGATFGGQVAVGLAGDRPGLVVAAALSARRDAALLIDLRRRSDHPRYRLLWVDLGALTSTVLVSFPATHGFDRFDLSGAPDGSFALVASRAGLPRHAVVWMRIAQDEERRRGHRERWEHGKNRERGEDGAELELLGFGMMRGEVAGPARASALGVSVPVRPSPGAPWEPVGYPYSDLHRAREDDLRACS